jgi:hypothetical protein
MNILVTTPKSEIENSKEEGLEVEKNGGYWFRTFNYAPKVLKNDKIYFVENGFITGYGRIFEVSQTSSGYQECEFTGRVWNGKYIVKYDTWVWLQNPVPFKGFQGIRYVQNIPDLQQKLDLAGEKNTITFF